MKPNSNEKQRKLGKEGKNTLVWLIVASLLWLITITLGVGRPEGQIVPQQLHDQRRVLVRVLVEGVQFSYRIIECLHIIQIKQHISQH